MHLFTHFLSDRPNTARCLILGNQKDSFCSSGSDKSRFFATKRNYDI